MGIHDDCSSFDNAYPHIHRGGGNILYKDHCAIGLFRDFAGRVHTIECQQKLHIRSVTYDFIIICICDLTEREVSGWIGIAHRIIPAIGKHVIAQQALSGTYQSVRVKESAHLWVVVSGLQIIQAGICVMELAIF